MSRSLVLTLIVTLCCSAPGLAQESKSRAPLGLSVIGASVSAGFGSGYDLAEILSTALGDSAEVQDLAESTLFLDVTKGGKKQIDGARDKSSELVVGIDFLFWYAAGAKDLPTRLADVESAFKELDRLPGQAVIGTIPNMRHVSPLMLPKSRQIPAEDLPAINEHIVKLAAERQRVRIITVDRWMDAIEDGEAAPEFERIGVESLDRSQLLLADGLHLSRDGLVLAATLLLDNLASNELKDREPIRRLTQLEERLAAMERNITIEIYDDKLEPSDVGLIRFDLPSVQEMRKMGLSLEDLLKLRGLKKYATPIELEGSNKLEINALPAVAARLAIRVRAERGQGMISRWTEVNLEHVESRVTLILRPVEELRIKVLSGDKAVALPEAMIAIAEEIEGRGLRLEHLTGDGPGHAISDKDGLVSIHGIGPDATQILVRTKDGRRSEFTIDRSSSPQVILISEAPPESEPKTEPKADEEAR